MARAVAPTPISAHAPSSWLDDGWLRSVILRPMIHKKPLPRENKAVSAACPAVDSRQLALEKLSALRSRPPVLRSIGASIDRESEKHGARSSLRRSFRASEDWSRYDQEPVLSSSALQRH